jgi:pimeloyl-ACP methyl ester carboxylesterase
MIVWEESGTGQPAVFVHGIAEDRRAWDPVIPLLEDSFRCIRLDLRGHGESGPADDYSALAMTQDVADVMQEAGVGVPPVLVGHSLGAVVVSVYAAQAPARAVVNVDQSLRLGDFGTTLQPLGPGLRGEGFAGVVAAVFDSLGTGLLPSAERELVERMHGSARQEVILGVWGLLLDTAPAELTMLAESVLAGVKMPYLAIHGNDPGEGYAAWLRGCVPGAVVELWPGDGHYPHLVEPARFAARVAEFALR